MHTYIGRHRSGQQTEKAPVVLLLDLQVKTFLGASSLSKKKQQQQCSSNLNYVNNRFL